MYRQLRLVAREDRVLLLSLERGEGDETLRCMRVMAFKSLALVVEIGIEAAWQRVWGCTTAFCLLSCVLQNPQDFNPPKFLINRDVPVLKKNKALVAYQSCQR